MEMKQCKVCNNMIAKRAKICPACGAKNKKLFYTRWWFILIAIIVVLGLIITISGGSDKSEGEKFNWADVSMSSLLPKPKENVGDIYSDSADYLSMYVYKTSKEEYKDYVKECKEKGFTVDGEYSDISFKAFNEAGYELSVSHYDEQMSITLVSPKKESETINVSTGEGEKGSTQIKTEASSLEQTEGQAQSTTQAVVSDNVIRPEVKEAIDSYEKFMDEYVAFMKKYSSSGGADITLIADYAKYMSKYAEMTKKFEEIKDDTMSAAETAYYIEVQTRVSKKLLEVGQ